MSTPLILPQVHPHNWPGQEKSSFKPIHTSMQPGPGAQTMPLVSWSYAAGALAAFVGPTWLEEQGQSAEDVHIESLGNLAAQECNYRVMDVSRPGEEKVLLGVCEQVRSDNPTHIAAADHILNKRAMLDLQRDLGAEPMVVAIPHAGALYAAGTGLVQSGAFLNLANQDPPGGGESLTAIVFLIQQGEIVGKVTYG